MSHDPARVAETREWLNKVGLDLRSAAVDLGAEPPLVEDALFHCQQAVEKSLKAFLIWHDTPFRKTHSLEELGRARCAVDPALLPSVDEAVPLTEYAWAFRYPGEAPVPDIEEGRSSLSIARSMVAAIVARLPEEAVPGGLH